MVKIENLSKYYKKNNKVVCKAIDNVSLNLPNTGFIFIIGKSGSGKSTLLNMIGTLDKSTTGNIIVDGVNVTKLNYNKAQEYRCSHLGFIFQNFILIEEMTVRENINLALNLIGSEKNQDELVTSVLKQVDLEGVEDKYPNELSGGQRQRVAIARALVKKPQMLLCDEPTGNLDFKTSKQVLDILKELSKEKLVIIVSHNLEDAENYADRIIELSDGKIISDLSKDNSLSNSFILEEDYAVLPHHKDLTTKDVIAINQKLKEKKIEIRQNKGTFVETKEIEEADRIFDNTSNKLNTKNIIKLSKIFSRKNRGFTWYTILITTLFISLFFVLEMFILFDGNESLKHVELDTVSVINLADRTNKNSFSQTHLQYISNEDVQKFYDNGYVGKIYPLYNYTCSVSSSLIRYGNINKLSGIMKYNAFTETLGTLCCDEEYLINKFGVDGKLVVLAGDLSQAKNKLILTDYTADALIAGKYYTDTADYKGVMKKYSSLYSAIIYTGYKEKYADIYEQEKVARENKVSSTNYLKSMSNSSRFRTFLEDAYNNYSLCYSFSTNFNEDIIPFTSSQGNLSYFYIEADGYEKQYYDKTLSISQNANVKDNNMIMSYTLYSQLFGKQYSPINESEFKPHTFKIIRLSDNETGSVIFEYEFMITGLGQTSYISKDAAINLNKHLAFVYGLRFNNIGQKDIIYKTASECGLIIDDIDSFVVPVVKTILFVFEGVCYLVIALLLIFSIVHIIMYGISSIKKSSYEIGVLKALGTKNNDIAKIFVIKLLMVSTIIIVISIFGMILAGQFSNYLLLKAFERFTQVKIYNLEIILIKPLIIFIDLFSVLIISIISTCIPLIYLRYLNPLNVLRDNKK